MSWRRLGVVLRHLPPESHYATAIRPTEAAQAPVQVTPEMLGPWSQSEQLLARIGDAVEGLAWMQSDGKSPRPKPYPRPGTVSPVTPINEDAVAYLLEVERLNGAAPGPDWLPPSQREPEVS